jgi:hypothetical protein
MESVTLVKCGHLPCHCLVEEEQKFCGPACAARAKAVEDVAPGAKRTDLESAPCRCAHPECHMAKRFQDEVAEPLKVD